MVTIVIFDSYLLRSAVKETYVSQLKGMTTAINGRYEESRSIQDVQQIFDYIKHMEEDILELNLHVKKDEQQKIMASTDRQSIGSHSTNTLSPTFDSGKTMIAHLSENKTHKVRLVAPLMEDGTVIGAIELYINNSDDVAKLQKQIQRTVVVGIVVGLLLLIILWFIIRKLLVLPLLSLREAASTIQQGNQYEALSLNASQEINEVASAFNEMVLNLEDRYYKSITDSLTGVFNSEYFKLKLSETIKHTNRSNRTMALLFCDVDNFKKLNDHEGHLYGDQVLEKIARIIVENVRTTDIVCRYGGEEFVVIMPETDEHNAKNIAEQIRHMIAIHGNQSVLTPISISIGVAVYPNDSDEKGLVHMADQAMYTAKGLGKNRVVTASELKDYKKQGYERRIDDQKWILNTIISLARAVEVKDSYTHSHSEMVSRYASTVASSMGLPDEEVKRISFAGLLHDVGKIGIPDQILNKDGRLTKEEYEIMKTHPVLGYNILASVEELKDILPYVLHHHERPDGKGYPYGLTKAEIPLGARIIAVVDAFHSMTSARPYRKSPLSIEKAIEELKRGKATQFDEEVVDDFLTILNDMKM